MKWCFHASLQLPKGRCKSLMQIINFKVERTRPCRASRSIESTITHIFKVLGIAQTQPNSEESVAICETNTLTTTYWENGFLITLHVSIGENSCSEYATLYKDKGEPIIRESWYLFSTRPIAEILKDDHLDVITHPAMTTINHSKSNLRLEVSSIRYFLYKNQNRSARYVKYQIGIGGSIEFRGDSCTLTSNLLNRKT